MQNQLTWMSVAQLAEQMRETDSGNYVSFAKSCPLNIISKFTLSAKSIRFIRKEKCSVNDLATSIQEKVSPTWRNRAQLDPFSGSSLSSARLQSIALTKVASKLASLGQSRLQGKNIAL